MTESGVVWRTLRKCKIQFLSAFGFGLFINLLMLAVPLFTMQVLDRVLSSGSKDTLVMLSVIVGVCLVTMGVLQALRSFVFQHVGRWLDDKLSVEIASKTTLLAVTKPGVGSQPLRDLASIRSFISSPAMVSTVDAPWAIIFFVGIYLINVSLGVAVTIGAVCLLLLSIVTERLPAKRIAKANETNVSAMRAISSILRNAEIIKAMGMADNAQRRWRNLNESYLELSFANSSILTTISSITKTLRLGLQVLLTGMGAWLVINGGMSAGGIIAVSILSGKALAPFDSGVAIYQGWIGVKKANGRLNDLFAAVQDAEPVIDLPDPEGAIEVEKIAYRISDDTPWIIRGINISISSGECIGVIGPSGGGKTTLARILVGVTNPTSGAVRIDGAALDQWDRKKLGNKVGYLPQDIELFEGTVAENIARLEENASGEKVVAAAKLAEVHDTILRLPSGYQTEVGANGRNLSAGQRQRIALARCFYGGPRVLVLDEPNSNLDTDGEASLISALANAKAEGITTIVIAHRPSVLNIVDKIVVLHSGEAKRFGPRQEVLSSMQVPNSKGQFQTPQSMQSNNRG